MEADPSSMPVEPAPAPPLRTVLVGTDLSQETRSAVKVTDHLVPSLSVGVVAGATAWAWQGLFEVGLVIFLSMVATCTIASIVGFLVPWLAHSAGKDPAAVADPFITTIKDVSGLLIYFGLATWLLGALL